MGLRWAFSLRQAEISPNFELYFRKALDALPSHDVIKQERFHYRNDSLTCVAGRIMIRAAVQTTLSIPWHEIQLEKTDRGKPFLSNNQLFFNVSHQGDLVVLASSGKNKIGVDVMRIDEDRGSTTAREHILKMKRLFSTRELEMMLGKQTDIDRWTAFYRIWCLKEAVLKATGIGLVDDLNTYSFECGDQDHSPGCIINDTVYSEKGQPGDRWKFEESFVGENHCVAVGKIYSSAEEASRASLRPKQFQFVTLEDLLAKATPLSDEDSAEAYGNFAKKPWKQF